MKNIREKSEDVFPDHCDDSMHELNIKMRIGFITGANYVLEQIENLPNKTIDVYNLIEQLKK